MTRRRRRVTSPPPPAPVPAAADPLELILPLLPAVVVAEAVPPPPSDPLEQILPLLPSDPPNPPVDPPAPPPPPPPQPQPSAPPFSPPSPPSPPPPPLPFAIPYPFAPTPLSTRLLEPTPSYLPRIPGHTSAVWPPPIPPLLYALHDFTFAAPSGAQPAFVVRDYSWLGLVRSSDGKEDAGSELATARFLRTFITPRTANPARGRTLAIDTLTPSAATALLMSGVYERGRRWDTFAFDVWVLRCLASCGASEWGVSKFIDGVGYYALSLPYPVLQEGAGGAVSCRRFTAALTTHGAFGNAAPWTLVAVAPPVPVPVPGAVGGAEDVQRWVLSCIDAVVERWEAAIAAIAQRSEDTVVVDGAETRGIELLRGWRGQLAGIRLLLVEVEVPGGGGWAGVAGAVTRLRACTAGVERLMDEVTGGACLAPAAAGVAGHEDGDGDGDGGELRALVRAWWEEVRAWAGELWALVWAWWEEVRVWAGEVGAGEGGQVGVGVCLLVVAVVVAVMMVWVAL